MKAVQDKIKVIPIDVPVTVVVPPVNPRANAAGVVNNALLAMFEDLYDPNNEDEVVAPVEEQELILDAAALTKILRDELALYQTTKGQLMMDGPKGPRDITAVYTNPLHWWALNH